MAASSKGDRAQNSFAGERLVKAPAQAAVRDSEPPLILDDATNSLVDAPIARRFKKRGTRAGKARKAAASCSSAQDH